MTFATDGWLGRVLRLLANACDSSSGTERRRTWDEGVMASVLSLSDFILWWQWRWTKGLLEPPVCWANRARPRPTLYPRKPSSWCQESVTTPLISGWRLQHTARRGDEMSDKGAQVRATGYASARAYGNEWSPPLVSRHES